MTEQQPKPHDAVLGRQEPLQSFREDVESVLRQIERENRAVEGELARVKRNNQQQMIKLLLEKGARQMLVPLIQKVAEVEVRQCDREEKLRQACDRLSQENRALKAQIAAVRYELNQNEEIERDRLLQLLEIEFSNELGDLMGIFYQARAIANRQRRGQTPSKPSLRLLVGLMDAFEERYPHFSRQTF